MFRKPPKQGPVEWLEWRDPTGPSAMVMDPELLGVKERKRIKFCLNMYEFFAKNLIPKSHVYRAQ